MQTGSRPRLWLKLEPHMRKCNLGPPSRKTCDHGSRRMNVSGGQRDPSDCLRPMVCCAGASPPVWNPRSSLGREGHAASLPLWRTARGRQWMTCLYQATSTKGLSTC
eukprot:1908203-Rhodomonas_salina.6